MPKTKTNEFKWLAALTNDQLAVAMRAMRDHYARYGEETAWTIYTAIINEHNKRKRIGAYRTKAKA